MPNKEPLWALWENEAASRLGGRVVPSSGSTDYFKGDVVTDRWLADCKYTENDTYTLSLPMWNKVSLWARNSNKLPLICVRIATGTDFVVLREIDYSSLSIDKDYSSVDARHDARSKAIGHHFSSGVFGLGNERLVCMPFEKFEKIIMDGKK